MTKKIKHKLQNDSFEDNKNNIINSLDDMVGKT